MLGGRAFVHCSTTGEKKRKNFFFTEAKQKRYYINFFLALCLWSPFPPQYAVGNGPWGVGGLTHNSVYNKTGAARQTNGRKNERTHKQYGNTTCVLRHLPIPIYTEERQADQSFFTRSSPIITPPPGICQKRTLLSGAKGGSLCEGEEGGGRGRGRGGGYSTVRYVTYTRIAHDITDDERRSM